MLRGRTEPNPAGLGPKFNLLHLDSVTELQWSCLSMCHRGKGTAKVSIVKTHLGPKRHFYEVPQTPALLSHCGPRGL